MTKKTYSFTLALDTFTNTTEGLEDKLYEASCDDALLYFMNNTIYLDFDREAESLEDAIATAVRDVTLGLPDYAILSIDIKRYFDEVKEAIRANIDTELNI